MGKALRRNTIRKLLRCRSFSVHSKDEEIWRSAHTCGDNAVCAVDVRQLQRDVIHWAAPSVTFRCPLFTFDDRNTVSLSTAHTHTPQPQPHSSWLVTRVQKSAVLHCQTMTEPDKNTNRIQLYEIFVGQIEVHSLLAAANRSLTSLIIRLICWLVFSNSFSCLLRFSRNSGLSRRQSVNSNGCKPAVTILTLSLSLDIIRCYTRGDVSSHSLTPKWCSDEEADHNKKKSRTTRSKHTAEQRGKHTARAPCFGTDVIYSFWIVSDPIFLIWIWPESKCVCMFWSSLAGQMPNVERTETRGNSTIFPNQQISSAGNLFLHIFSSWMMLNIVVTHQSLTRHAHKRETNSNNVSNPRYKITFPLFSHFTKFVFQSTRISIVFK